MLPSSKIQLILINPETIHHLLHILHTVARILIGDKSHGSYPRDQFTVFIKDWDVGAECILSKFADDTKLGWVVDVPKGCADIQTDLSRVEKWAEGNLVKFNKGKHKALHLKKEELRPWYTSELHSWKAALPRRTCECMQVGQHNEDAPAKCHCSKED